MSEIDTEIRYGLIDPETSERFPHEKAAKGLSIRIFEEDEDAQWCAGVLSRRSKGSKVPFNRTRHETSKEELGAKVTEAREEGKVPFRVAGPNAKILPFLKQAGIAEVDLIR